MKMFSKISWLKIVFLAVPLFGLAVASTFESSEAAAEDKTLMDANSEADSQDEYVSLFLISVPQRS